MALWVIVSTNTQQSATKVAESDEAKQIKSAIAELEQSLASNPQNVENKILLGNLYVRQGNVGRAIKEFEAIIRLKPDFTAVSA